MSSSIIDLVIRIKNGYMARRDQISSPHSRFREDVLKKLQSLGYVKEYAVEGDIIKNITITLAYPEGMPAVTDVKIQSKPGRRWYTGSKRLKSVLGGLGVSLVSTSKGIMTNKEAQKNKIGGELLFEIW